MVTAAMTRPEIASALAARARALYDRGLTCSSGGNLSHRLETGFLMEAANTSFASLGLEDFVACGLDGAALEPHPKPSKEAPFHAAIYRRRPDVRAIVHLHSPQAIALSCLARPTDEGNVLPAITAYAAIRVGRVPLVEYHAPGSPSLVARVEQTCGGGIAALLLQNHGVITFAETLEAAANIAEELEQTISIWLATGGQARPLTDEELRATKPLGAAIAPGTQLPTLLPGVVLAPGRR